MQPRLSTIWNRLWMSILMISYTVWVSFCPKYTTLLTCPRFQQRALTIMTVVYGLNCRKLNTAWHGHQSMQWRKMELFRGISVISDQHMNELLGYCRTKFSIPDASGFYEVKTMKKTGPHYKCRGPHFQHSDCTHSSNNFKN